jgi:hypothetical protein
MAHGHHWNALVDDVEAVITDIVPLILEKGLPVPGTREHRAYCEAHPDESSMIAFAYPSAGPVGFLGIVARNPIEKELNFVTGFPFLKDGVVSTLEVLSVDSETFEGLTGFEATVEAITAQGVTVTFFDPLYCCLGPDAYGDGIQRPRRFEFSVSALAYSVEKVHDTDIVLTSGAALEMERERIRREDPNADLSEVTSVTISMAELRSLLPRDEPGDAEFQTVVEDIDFFELEKVGTMCRMKVVLMRPDEQDFGAILYASEKVLGEYRPARGDSIRGALWLQAHSLRPSNVSGPAWVDRAMPSTAEYYPAEVDVFLDDNFFADLPMGPAALAKAIIAAGWDVTLYANDQNASWIPTFQIGRRETKAAVWVRSFVQDQEPVVSFTQTEVAENERSAEEQSLKAVCIVVALKETDDGYLFSYDGIESLQSFMGGSFPLLEYKSKASMRPS